MNLEDESTVHLDEIDTFSRIDYKVVPYDVLCVIFCFIKTSTLCTAHC